MKKRALVLLIVVLLFAGGAFWVVMGTPGVPMEEAPLMHEPEAVEETAAASGSLIGLWQSTGDVNFTREFRSDGTVIDTYGGPEHAESVGTWEGFAGDNAPYAAPFPLESGATYVRILFDGEAYHYRVTLVSDSSLELIYMERGGALHFTRF